MLNKNDLNFILDKTKLPLKSLLNLIEEERDFNLVIDSIASTLTVKDLPSISLLSKKLQTKLVLYYTSKNTNYNIEEKSYISDIVMKNFNEIYKDHLIKEQKPPISYLIRAINSGVISQDRLASITNGFNKLGQKDVSSHILDWINIINNTKQIFSVIN